LRLSRECAGGNADGNDLIAAVDGTLALAHTAIERLYEQLDMDAIRDAWPTRNQQRFARPARA
jgi:hypothetical protein